MTPDAFPNDGRVDHPLEGVGFSGAPCYRLNVPGYLVSLPARYLLCFDNLGDLNISPFFNNILAAQQNPMPPDLIIDLFALQGCILRAFE